MPDDIVPQGHPAEIFAIIRWDAQDLVPVIVQDRTDGEVLMFAWADRDALQRTLATGIATFFSRSRGRQWVKGETTGHIQRVVELRADCDGDCVLYRVDPVGPACHQLRRSCFSHRIDADGSVHTDKPVIG